MRSWTLVASLGLLASVVMVFLGILEVVDGHGLLWAVFLGCGLVMVIRNARLVLRGPTCRRDLT